MKPKLTRRIYVAVIAALGVLATVGIGVAAIPGADGQVHGCYATTNGVLLGIPHSKGDTRIVDSGEACRNYEKELAWSQKGPKGDPGAKGDQGLTGEACLPANPACVGPKGDKGDKGDGCPSTDPACVGPKGDKGDTGAPGAPGTSESFAAGLPTRPVIVGHLDEVAAINLGPGDYAVTATTALLDLDRNATALCTLMTDTHQEETQDIHFAEGRENTTTLLGNFSLPSGGRVGIRCSTQDAGVESRRSKVLAIKVGTAHPTL